MQKNSAILLLVAIVFFSQTILSQIKVSPINFKERTLANGMRVVTYPDNSSPTVSIHLWYDVGGKNDPNGRSGFAHMFEHMMFKSTTNMPSEKLDRITEDVGGFNNASTWDDFTNYYEVVPSNYLEVLLWAESDRMVNLNVDEKNFASERDVVKEEYRQSVLAQPYGRFFEYISSLSYEKHPYQRGVIGNLDELSAATTKDANEFYKTFYRPDNATLIVVGDFDQTQLDNWVDKYFAKIPKPASTIPRVTVQEPQRTGEKRFVKTAPNVPFPAVAITYLGPNPKNPDYPALEVAEAILSSGESSRLYQNLVYQQQIAQEASLTIDDRVDDGLFYFYAIASEGHRAEEMEKSLLAELKRIQTKPVTAKELQKAKNKLITESLQAIETNDGKAIAIERAMVYQGNAKAVNEKIAKLEAVTSADVQRVMKRYFTDKNRVVIYYQQGEESK